MLPFEFCCAFLALKTHFFFKTNLPLINQFNIYLLYHSVKHSIKSFAKCGHVVLTKQCETLQHLDDLIKNNVEEGLKVSFLSNWSTF